MLPRLTTRPFIHSLDPVSYSFIGYLKSIAAFLVFITFFTQADAQGFLVNRSETYDTDSKIKAEKGENYKREIKNGKLHIRNKGKIQRMLTGVYRGLDAYAECYDFEAKFEVKFVEGNGASGFGMEFYTLDAKQTTKYFNQVKFIFTTDGKLQFYNGADEKMDIDKSVPEACPSFKPAEVNNIEMIRKKKDWYLVVNKDTVKHITEEFLHPVIKLYSGNYMLYGSCELELDNFTYVVRRDADADEKRFKKLNTIAGSYLTYSSCLKTPNKRVTLYLKQDAKLNTKFTLTGLGVDAITLYLDEKEENVFSHYDIENFSMGGATYSLRKLKITQNAGGSIHNLTFNVFTEDAKTITNCDFDGDQSFESLVTTTSEAPVKPADVKPVYTKKGKYIDGLALVESNKKYGYVDESGKEVVPPTYGFAQDFSEGMAGVWQNEKYGFIDKTGKLVIPIKYDETFLGFSNGLAAVKLNGKWGFINKKGETKIPFNYEKAMVFREGLVAVKLNEKWGYIDTTGKVIIPMKFDCGNSFNEGLSVACLAGKYGYINKRGEQIIPVIYNDAYGFKDGKVRMILNGQSFYFDKAGKAASE